MAITAAQVKELRERTGAAMMDCKKALVASEGDIEAAAQELRKRGQAKADKKSGRVAAEGVILVKVSDDGKRAMMLEVNSETDFVARDDNFKAFADLVADYALAEQVDSIDTLSQATLTDGETVEEKRKALIAKIGENIQLRRLHQFASEGVLGTYVHGGRIGVVADLTGDKEQVAKDIAMHIAACNPVVVRPEDVSEELVNKEKEVFTAQAEQSGKPAQIVEQMITGRIEKFLGEVSLVGQPFVKDPATKVSQYLKAEGMNVNSFTRFEVGEGIEKQEDNFADEVMAQVRESQGQ